MFETVTQPEYVSCTSLHVLQREPGGSHVGFFDIEERWRSDPAVRHWCHDDAHLVDESCAEHRAVDLPSPLEHQRADTEPRPDFLQGERRVEITLPRDQVGG